MEEKIKSVIRDIKDFPKPGIVFKDITPILLDNTLCKEIVDEFVKQLGDKKFDKMVAVESRGFMFGMLLAQELQIPFVPIRKEGKLPGDTVAHSYDLEYGSAVIEIHAGDISNGDKVLIHDDLLATGGTAAASAELVKGQGAIIESITFIVELGFLNGREKLLSYTDQVISLAIYN